MKTANCPSCGAPVSFKSAASVYAVCEFCRSTVLRDGDYVDTLKTASCTVDDIIKRMVGREIDNSQKQSSDVPADAEVVLRARGLTSSAVRDVSFELRRGEILGFAGLVGAGRTETMQILCGADPWGTGEIEVHGMPMHFTHPKQAISAGIAYLISGILLFFGETEIAGFDHIFRLDDVFKLFFG